MNCSAGALVGFGDTRGRHIAIVAVAAPVLCPLFARDGPFGGVVCIPDVGAHATNPPLDATTGFPDNAGTPRVVGDFVAPPVLCTLFARDGPFGGVVCISDVGAPVLCTLFAQVHLLVHPVTEIGIANIIASRYCQ